VHSSERRDEREGRDLRIKTGAVGRKQEIGWEKEIRD